MLTDAIFTATTVVAEGVVPQASVIIRVKGSLSISDGLVDSVVVSDEGTATCTLLDSLVGRIIVSDS
jgi:hypothetical protein